MFCWNAVPVFLVIVKIIRCCSFICSPSAGGRVVSGIRQQASRLCSPDKPGSIYGDGCQSRDFVYVEDVAQANLRACFAPRTACGQAYNVASGRTVDLLEMYGVIARALGKDVEPEFAGERPGDVRHSSADIGKARRALGYDPAFPFEEGLSRTMDWYKDYFRAEAAQGA